MKFKNQFFRFKCLVGHMWLGTATMDSAVVKPAEEVQQPPLPEVPLSWDFCSPQSPVVYLQTSWNSHCPQDHEVSHQAVVSTRTWLILHPEYLWQHATCRLLLTSIRHQIKSESISMLAFNKPFKADSCVSCAYTCHFISSLIWDGEHRSSERTHWTFITALLQLF